MVGRLIQSQISYQYSLIFKQLWHTRAGRPRIRRSFTAI